MAAVHYFPHEFWKPKGDGTLYPTSLHGHTKLLVCFCNSLQTSSSYWLKSDCHYCFHGLLKICHYLFQHCQCKHVSMEMLAISSKYYYPNNTLPWLETPSLFSCLFKFLILYFLIRNTAWLSLCLDDYSKKNTLTWLLLMVLLIFFCFWDLVQFIAHWSEHLNYKPSDRNTLCSTHVRLYIIPGYLQDSFESKQTAAIQTLNKRFCFKQNKGGFFWVTILKHIFRVIPLA